MQLQCNECKSVQYKNISPAGFSDPDLAKAAYSLAVKYELIDKATAGNIKAVAYTDTEELEAVIPR